MFTWVEKKVHVGTEVLIWKQVLDFQFQYYAQSREKLEIGLFMLKILFKTGFSCTFGGH